MAYNRYKNFVKNGSHKMIPFINIPKKNTDYYITYNRNKMRLDSISYQYYDDPNYGWLILQANPHLGSLEYKITNGSVIRIPYPLEETLAQYEEGITNYERLHGIR